MGIGAPVTGRAFNVEGRELTATRQVCAMSLDLSDSETRHLKELLVRMLLSVGQVSDCPMNHLLSC